MLKLFIILLGLIIVTTFAVNVIAADIRPIIEGNGSYRQVVIEGKIEPGDSVTFNRIMKENQGKVGTVYLFSPGGDFSEAMKIGRTMRALEVASMVPMLNSAGRPECDGYGEPKLKDSKNCTCASACFFIHIGAIHRGGTYLNVHRPYFEKGKFGELSQTDAQKAFDALQESGRNYMQEMGVPKHIQEDVLGTSSDRSLILDDKTVKTYFWGELPYRHEWKRNKCSKLTASETQQYKDFSGRILKAKKGAPNKGLSDSENEDWKTLQKKKREESDCDINIERQSRISAYERYFGVQPSDYEGYNFSKWSDATKYLGRQFYELMSEERFEEDKLSKYSFLKRSFTANAPAVSLSDMHSSPKVVGWISIVSSANPSPEFIKRLVKSLENTWGERMGGDGVTEWLWDKKEFSANLIYERLKAEKGYMSLEIQAK